MEHLRPWVPWAWWLARFYLLPLMEPDLHPDWHPFLSAIIFPLCLLPSDPLRSPSMTPTPPEQSHMGCGTYPEEEFLSLSCRHNFDMNPGHRNLIVERKHTYTYRLTFWHIINTFLLLAGGNLWKNQVQHSQNTLVTPFSKNTVTGLQLQIG